MATTAPDPASSSSSYDGQALASNEIRLLTIKAISKTSRSPKLRASAGARVKKHARKITRRPLEISIELQTHRHELTEDLDYDAISYVWGTAPASVTVLCNNKPLLITPTAHKMLEYLYQYQANTAPRNIWIDAICINQEDEEEKSTQIPLMRDIYSRAAAVIVWMGPSTREINVFFAEFKDVRENSKAWITQFAGNPGCSEPVKEELPSHEKAFWGGLSQILNNDWFTRLWTFQEIILASTATLLCGNFWIDVDEFIGFIEDGWYNSNYISRRSGIGRIAINTATTRTCDSITFHRNRSTKDARAKGIRLLYVAFELNELRTRHVKEPVDRVWAIVGLLKNGFRDRLTLGIDYSDQGRDEFWKTWIMFAKALVDESGEMGLLEIPPTLEPRPSYLPSWCPNLSGRSACRMLVTGTWNDTIGVRDLGVRWALFEENNERKSKERVRAIEKHEKKSIDTVGPDNVLRVHGFVVDTIEEVVEHEKPLDIAYGHCDELSEEHMNLYRAAVNKHLEGLGLARRVFYGKSQGVTDIPDDFIMALFLDPRINEKAKDAYCEALPKLATWYSISDADETWEQSMCHQRLIDIRGHTFFSTKGGRIGYAHPGCQPGDQVVAFYGGDPLYILRQLDTTSDDNDSTGEPSHHVQYMGAAFIPHLMEQHQRDAAHIGPDTMFYIH